MQKREQNYDIIIVGGGLAGLALACLLGRHGMRIACIDQSDPAQSPKDLRTTAISYGSRKILERAGIWGLISEACPINDIQILDGASPVLLEFMSTEVANKSFGWIVDNHDLKQALLTRMRDFKTVDYIAPLGVADFTITDTGVTVYGSDETTLNAKLVIGADGRQSAVREYMMKNFDLQTRTWDYGQRAVICMVEHERPHNYVAVEHFWPQGPFAILPFTDTADGRHRSAVVFTEHGPDKDSLMHMDEQTFNLALAARFPQNYGAVQLSGRRAAYPLNLVHAQEYIAPAHRPRMALVSDAAHGIHPIAGQGLNLGFRDLGLLDDLLGAAFQNGADIADPELLQTYQRRRRPDNLAMIAMTDGLNRLFSNNILPIRVLRKTGLRLVSKIRPAKQFFMKQAMGDR